MDPTLLRPRRHKPGPLPANFGDATSVAASTLATADYRSRVMMPTALQFDDSSASDVGTAESLTSRHHMISQRLGETEATDVSKLTDRLMQDNRYMLDAEALKKASSALNITHNQYSNLIPLDFDEGALIQQNDDARLRAREKTVKSALKK